MENEIVQLKKTAKITQILLVVTLVFTFLMFAMFVCVGVVAYNGYKEVLPYINQIQTIDMNQFNTVVDKLANLDVDSLTKTLSDLEKDMSVISEAIISMQEAVDNFKSGMGSLFGF